MLTPKNKNLLLWVAGISFALICCLIVFPTILFKFYPYSILFTLLYLALTVCIPIVYFKLKKSVYKKISFALFCVPACVLIIVLISIQAGWIAYP